MLVLDYLINNGILLFELVGLLIMVRISAHISLRIKRLTVAAVVLLFLQSLAFYFEQWTQTFETLSVLRPLLTAFVYSVYPAILLVTMQIINDRKLSKVKWALMLLPEIVSVPVYFSSQWLHLVCFYTNDNKYTGGFFPYWPYVVFGIYLVIFVVRNILYFKNYSLMEKIASLYIIIVPTVCFVLILFFGAADNTCDLFTAAILLYYLLMYIHMSRVDSLTRLFNRQSYYQDIKHYGNSISGIISIDMNELKYFNDNIGHEAGDTALKAVSRAIIAGCGEGASAYRVGGDEFIVFYNNADENKLASAVAAMRKELGKTPYTCAFGYALRSRGDDLEEAITEADGKMYENKAAMKKEMAEKGEILHSRQD